MKTIHNLWFSKNTLAWDSEGVSRTEHLDTDIGSALLLKSNGIAVTMNDGSAVILDANGKLRAKLVNPYRPEQGFTFYYFNYEFDELIVVLASALRDYKCKVDEMTGLLSLPQETR